MRCAGESFDYSAVTGACYLRDSVRGSVALSGASGADAVYEWCHYDKTGGSLAGGGAAAAVNCVGEWGEWGGCACGSATEERTYSVRTPAAHGGTACPDPLTESRACTPLGCPGSPAGGRAQLCDDVAQAQYEKCTSNCSLECDSAAFSGGNACDVLVLPRPAEQAYLTTCDGNEQRDLGHVCALLLQDISSNPSCCPTVEGISEHDAECPAGFPLDQCSFQCAPSLLYYFQKCRTLYDGTDDAPRLANAALNCEEAMLREEARDVLADGQHYTYLPVAAWVMALVPYLFFLVFVFFGRHVATIFRMVVAAVALSVPILWPVVSPFIQTCGIGSENSGVGLVSAGCSAERPPISAATLVQPIFAVMVGAGAAYTCRNLRGVGNCVQGFALGYVLAAWATDILIGGVTQNVDTQWMLMGISALSGGGAATLNYMFPTLMNIIGSASIGTFCCCQVRFNPILIRFNPI